MTVPGICMGSMCLQKYCECPHCMEALDPSARDNTLQANGVDLCGEQDTNAPLCLKRKKKKKKITTSLTCKESQIPLVSCKVCRTSDFGKFRYRWNLEETFFSVLLVYLKPIKHEMVLAACYFFWCNLRIQNLLTSREGVRVSLIGGFVDLSKKCTKQCVQWEPL